MHSRFLRCLSLCGLVPFAHLAHAVQQGAPPQPAWQQACAAATAQPLAEQSPAGPLSGEALQHCDEMTLYYGFGAKPDDAAALQCGWWQHAHPQQTVGNMFYGPGVLSMLYANGRAVPRNYDLALRFVCENTWAAPAETEGRVEHLAQLKGAASHGAPKDFDLCDDGTSGLSMGFCMDVQTRTAGATRDALIQAIVSKLPASARASFPELQAAQATFAKARSRNEIDLSGTGRAAFALEEEAKLADQFLINLQRFGKGAIPNVSAANAAALDRRLNDTYKQLQQRTWPQGVTINAAGVRDTERAWVSLADAWSRFAQTAYPQLSSVRVRAQLMRLRLHQVQSLQSLQSE